MSTESRPAPPLVFVSHSGEDTQAAKDVANELRRMNIDVWLDVERIQPGDVWVQSIESALSAADGMIVYVGSSGVQRWVDSEVRVALDFSAKSPRFRIVPLLGPGSDSNSLPLFLQQHQWIDLRLGIRNLPNLRDLFAAAPSRVRESVLPPDTPPYLGLATFGVDDAMLFYGREDEVQKLLDKLAAGFLAVVGGSGTGKSSLVRAGLIPALHRGRFHHDRAWVESWRVAILRPGKDPFRSLAEAIPDLKPEMTEGARADFLARIKEHLSGGTGGLATGIAALNLRAHVLIVVDQFEELFTQTADPAERRRFIDSLFDAVQTGERPVYLVITMRADFYGRCWEHPELPARIAANQSAIQRLGPDQLRDIIERPLALAGADAERGLVDVLLDDVGDEPGNLALLEHALLQLWEKRSGRTLTHEAYKRIGGLSGALRNHAENEFVRLGDDQTIAKKIFIRLTQIGAGAPDTRRPAGKLELLSLSSPERAERVLAALARARLITITAPVSGTDKEADAAAVVEVSHEALIREWPRLREWLNENRKALIVEGRIEQTAMEWAHAKRDSGLLLTGTRLREGEELLSDPEREVSPLIREFIRASSLHAQKEIGRARTLRWSVWSAVAVLVLLLGWWAWDAAASLRRMRADAIFVETNTGLQWTRKDNLTDIEWTDADRYCRELTLYGRSGWRLPSINEVKRLYTRHRDEFNFDRLTGANIWTSTREPDTLPGQELRYIYFDTKLDLETLAPAGFSNFTRALCVSGGEGAP